MSGNTIGKLFTVTTFGESHGGADYIWTHWCSGRIQKSRLYSERLVGWNFRTNH